MAHHTETGKKGEALARVYLEQNGFIILHCNWRYSHYEIDIIASKNNTLHFIEVKTRRTTTYGYPEESVSGTKRKSLLKGAEEFLYQNPGWTRIQHNILSISLIRNSPPEYFFIEDIM